MELSKKLENLIKARELINNSIKEDLRMDIVWLSNAREAIGALNVSILRLEEAIKKKKEKKFNRFGLAY